MQQVSLDEGFFEGLGLSSPLAALQHFEETCASQYVVAMTMFGTPFLIEVVCLKEL